MRRYNPDGSVTDDRYLLCEQYIRHPVYDGSTIHTWVYHYSDGTTETVRMRVRK